MLIHLLCSNPQHPVVSYLKKIAVAQDDVQIIHSATEAVGGDLLFLVSCGEYVKKSTRMAYKKVLVLHASDLPQGRGWSPYIWDILHGKQEICVSLIEAAGKIDQGDIWKKIKLQLQGHELYDEVNQKIFQAEVDLILWAIDNVDKVVPIKQETGGFTAHRMRTPKDSEIDIDKSIKENFNLLRVCDPVRFPAYFSHLGYDYKIVIEKIKKTED